VVSSRVGNFRLLTRRGVDYFRQHRERMRNVNAIMALMGLRTGLCGGATPPAAPWPQHLHFGPFHTHGVVGNCRLVLSGLKSDK
jgi:hypothetical protein